MGEIEAVLREHERVREAVVVVREDEAGEKRLVGYVVGGRGGSGDEQWSCESICEERLPEYMVPAAIVCAGGAAADARMGRWIGEALPAPEQAAARAAELCGAADAGGRDGGGDLGGGAGGGAGGSAGQLLRAGRAFAAGDAGDVAGAAGVRGGGGAAESV